MKQNLSKLIIYLGIFALLLGTITTFARTPSHAANLQVIGNELGLEVTPTDTKLFDLTNMNQEIQKKLKLISKT